MARSLVSAGGDTSDTASTSLNFPDVRHLRQREKGVPAVGVHPEVPAPTPADRHELAVVYPRAVGQRDAHAVAFQLLQMYAITRCHGRLRRRQLSSVVLRQGHAGALTETGRKDY